MNKKEYYEANGYFVQKQLIDIKLIDAFNNEIKKTFAENEINYGQMDTQKKGIAKFTKEGFLINPIGDVHLCKYYNKNLSYANELVISMLSSDSIKETFLELTNHPSQSVVMSMYFDKNAGTPAHQDWYYLDSEERGGITAIWIALEDIFEEAGRFYVVPKSHKTFFDLTEKEIRNSDLYEQIVKDHIGKKKLKLYAPELKKGDALFWNSGTIHGSFETTNHIFSRKSITAHYIPQSSQYVQNTYIKTPRSIEGFKKNDFIFKVTNSVKDNKIEKNLKPRTLKSFNR